MQQEIVPDPHPLRCECGSEQVCLAYACPVFVCLSGSEVTRVVVADEETNFGSVIRCLVCDRFWILDEEPELREWPHWEFGW